MPQTPSKYYETRTINKSDNFPYFKVETNYDFEEAHSTIPRLIAETSKELGVKQFIHLSAVGSTTDNKSSGCSLSLLEIPIASSLPFNFLIFVFVTNLPFIGDWRQFFSRCNVDIIFAALLRQYV